MAGDLTGMIKSMIELLEATKVRTLGARVHPIPDLVDGKAIVMPVLIYSCYRMELYNIIMLVISEWF